MNDEHAPRAKLVAELFHQDWATGPAAGYALAAAALARRRRFIRRVLTTAGAATGVAAALVFVFLHHPVVPKPATIVVRPALPAYEIISDDELLGRLNDRPLLVVQRETGPTEFVLLDR